MALAASKIQHPRICAYQPGRPKVSVKSIKNGPARGTPGQIRQVRTLISQFAYNFTGSRVNQHNAVIYYHIFIGPDRQVPRARPLGAPSGAGRFPVRALRYGIPPLAVLGPRARARSCGRSFAAERV